MNSQFNKQFYKHRFIEHANGLSLAEINGTVDVPKGRSFFKTLLAYFGLGTLVAVDYMDPDDWSTSITGGWNFQYLLMSVISMFSLIAMLLQYMAAELGIVTQMDLVQAIRARTSKTLGAILRILAELVTIVADITEVIGTAITLCLLLDISLVVTVLVTVLDALVLSLLTKIEFRKVEALIVRLIFIILFVFVYRVGLSNPDRHNLFAGFTLSSYILSDSPVMGGETSLIRVLEIIGTTVILHSLYLHSVVFQTREINHQDEEDVAQAARFSTWDLNTQSSTAFPVNALLLVMSVAVSKTGSVQDPSFFGLYEALSNPSAMSNGILIVVAKSGILSTLFAAVFLASDQSSITTGTLTSQVIAEGFIHVRILIWLGGLATRLPSVIPVLVCVSFTSTEGTIEEHTALSDSTNKSQVFLVFVLSFSMIPSLIITSNQAEMGNRFKNSFVAKLPGWFSVTSLTYLNLRGLSGQIESFSGEQTTSVQLVLADQIAHVITALVLLPLAWMIDDLCKRNKKYEQRLQETIEEIE